MNISVRHIGGTAHKPAKLIEITVENNHSSMTEDLVELKTGKVPDYFIDNLEQIIQELKEHNELVDNE